MSAFGLSTLWNLIIAPRAAFEALRAKPTWVAALVITSVLAAISTFIMQPAVAHALAVSLPAQMAQDPRYATLTADQRNNAVAVAQSLVRFGWIFPLFFTSLVAVFGGVVLLIVSIAGRGTANFARTFALSANVAFIWVALGQLVTAFIVVLRGPQAFGSAFELNLAIPSLAWLVPSAPLKVLGFLAGFNPFSLWATALLGAGTAAIAQTRPAIAYTAAVILLLCGCGALALGAR